MAGRTLLLLVLAALALDGCSSGTSPSVAPPAPAAAADASAFPPTPLQTVMSAGGKLRVDVRTAPTQPPSIGVQTVELVIADATTGAPVSGLALDVVPWMPAMGHGASVRPTTTEVSPGSYDITDVDLFMVGTWELRTSVSGSIADQIVPSFDIR